MSIFGSYWQFAFIDIQQCLGLAQYELPKTFMIWSKVTDTSQVPSVQFSSVTQLYRTLCNPMNRSTPDLPVHHQLPEFTQTHADRVSDAIQTSHPWSSPSPPAPNPSQNQGLSNESTLPMGWPKYWSFSFSIIPSKEIPGPISFRMDWLGLLAVQGTLLQSKGLNEPLLAK